MKVKNIMFFGFAAAILTGTANAAVPFQIASKAYVDPAADGNVIRVANSTGANLTALDTALGSLSEDVDEAIEAALGENFPENSTVADELDKKQDALVTSGNDANFVGSNGVAITESNGVITVAGTAATDQANGVVKLYSTTGSNTDGAMTQDAVTSALGTLDAAINGDGQTPGLDDRVQALEGTVGTGTMTVAGTTQSDVIAAINALDDKTEGIATDANIQALEQAINLKQDKSDSNVTTAGTYIQTGTGVAANLGRLDTAVGNVATAINGDGTAQNPGLAAEVADLQDAINGDGQNDGLADRVDDLEDAINGDGTNQGLAADVSDLQTLTAILSGYSTCVATATSGHCVLTAAHGENGQQDTLSWTDVSDPFEVE